jgi:acyl-[acyl-carrier-protein]-phospholipid O-acyltransferase/long-chain-fatty-acid--[acyl-carrier-protein] ligase
VPVSALAMAGFMIAVAQRVRPFRPSDAAGADRHLPAASRAAWQYHVRAGGIALPGGMFIVPLYAILQTRSAPEERSRVIAANNIVNAAVMVGLVVVAAMLLSRGVASRRHRHDGLRHAGGRAVSCWLLPETVIKRASAGS